MHQKEGNAACHLAPARPRDCIGGTTFRSSSIGGRHAPFQTGSSQGPLSGVQEPWTPQHRAEGGQLSDLVARRMGRRRADFARRGQSHMFTTEAVEQQLLGLTHCHPLPLGSFPGGGTVLCGNPVQHSGALFRTRQHTLQDCLQAQNIWKSPVLRS